MEKGGEKPYTSVTTSLGWQPEEEYETDIYSFGIEDEGRLYRNLGLGISYAYLDNFRVYNARPENNSISCRTVMRV